MTARLAARLLADGMRLHLSDGPIDLVVQAFGSARSIADAYAAAAARAATVLDELCAELALLRHPAEPAMAPAQSAVGRRMQQAVLPHAAGFITPMAAVAGAIAEAVLAAMTEAAPLRRAYVNNGGDIALHLAPGESLSVGLIDRPDRPALFGTAILRAGDGIGGIASSGWRGRSFSLGIADAVTVLATGAAEADAAATVIANAVDLPDLRIVRLPACTLDPDSDLGARLVTRAVPSLTAPQRLAALQAGARVARRLLGDGMVRAVALHVQGVSHTECTPRRLAA